MKERKKEGHARIIVLLRKNTIRMHVHKQHKKEKKMPAFGMEESFFFLAYREDSTRRLFSGKEVSLGGGDCS